MGAAHTNPFTPGTGIAPPYRAGHEEAANVLAGKLDEIVANRRGDIVVLYGPRGNGKTVLLDEVISRARKSGVRVVDPTTSALGGPVSVARSLLPRRRFGLWRIKTLIAGFAGMSAGVEMRDLPESEEEYLRERMRNHPLLLVVDEAHDMHLRTGKFLLQFAQKCVTERCPFLLLLAGTPGLLSHLEKTGATFWERSTQLRIGRLESEDDIRRAIAIPAKQSGLPADEDALDLLAQESQGYPYFIQMLAAAAWDAAFARKGAMRLELKDAQTGVANAERHRRRFYLRRYAEAEEQGVLAAATAVSREMVARGTSPKLERHELTEILEAVAPGADETPLSVREKLGLIGFIWETDDGGWEPGIPSLCAFFVEEARKAAGKGS